MRESHTKQTHKLSTFLPATSACHFVHLCVPLFCAISKHIYIWLGSAILVAVYIYHYTFLSLPNYIVISSVYHIPLRLHHERTSVHVTFHLTIQKVRLRTITSCQGIDQYHFFFRTIQLRFHFVFRLISQLRLLCVSASFLSDSFFVATSDA